MFALEITFKDAVSQPEMIFVRRPQALIGASDSAHVVVEDMSKLNYQLRIIRDLGRKFRCKPVGGEGDLLVPDMMESIYDGAADFDAGPVHFHVTSLDLDLFLKENEPPDKAGVRILRRACSGSAPTFPALVVLGAEPMIVSFVPDQSVYIGRSKPCLLRLDVPEVSAMHARVDYESGQFWVEDLGSTNGTFINQQQVAGRVGITAGASIILARQVTIVGVANEDQLQRIISRGGATSMRQMPVQEQRYPVLVSVSKIARPARLVLSPGAAVNIGREPASDMWLGAPHVSRRHCSVSMGKTGTLTIADHSMNGTAYDGGVLHKGNSLDLGDEPKVLDFGGGITVAICFNEKQEEMFTSSGGAADTFRPPEPLSRLELRPGRSNQAGLRRSERGSDSGVRLQILDVFRSLSITGKALFIFTCCSVIFLVCLVCYLLVGVLL